MKHHGPEVQMLITLIPLLLLLAVLVVLGHELIERVANAVEELR